MPQVDLSALSGPELRRLLDTSRARGQAALSYQILQEMAARRDAPRPAGLSLMRRPSEPRVVALRLDDPLDREDEPGPEAIPEAAEVSAAPRGVWDGVPQASEDALPHLALDGVRPPRHRGLGTAMGFAAGLAAGVAGGWWGGGMLREAPSPSAPAAGGELQIVDAGPRDVPAVQLSVEGVAAPPAPAQPVASPPAATIQAEAAAASPDTAGLTQDATARVAEPPPTEATAPADACAAQPTPADREICADPELRRLQRDLRQAYAQALEAHEERGLLRQRQLAWASARDGVADPDRLAALYEERIRRLNAAAAAARQRR